jgi:DNA polymerase III sliding clamp (beta) subunit (PCNA family)
MTTVTQTKTIPFEKLLIDLKKFTAGSNSPRPVLELIYFDGTCLYATDSHVAIRVKSDLVEVPTSDPFLYNPNKGEFVDLNHYKYPSLDRIFPIDHNTEIKLNNNELKKLKQSTNEIHKAVKNKRNRVSKVQVSNNLIQLSAYENEEVNEKVPLTNTSGEDINFHVNAKFLKDALVTAEKLNKVSQMTSDIRLISNMRPIVITDNNAYDIVVTPVRVY